MNRPMNRYVSLIRGINVGGHRAIKMADLRALYEAQGARHVASYIQSGNVAFSSLAEPAALEDELAAAIASTYGFEAPVIVRRAEDLCAIRDENPFVDEAEEDPRKVVVLFASDEVDEAQVVELLEGYEGPEIAVCRAHEIVVWFPEGQGRSRFPTARLERTLGSALTARNWKTIIKLCEMTEAGER